MNRRRSFLINHLRTLRTIHSWRFSNILQYSKGLPSKTRDVGSKQVWCGVCVCVCVCVCVVCVCVYLCAYVRDEEKRKKKRKEKKREKGIWWVQRKNLFSYCLFALCRMFCYKHNIFPNVGVLWYVLVLLWCHFRLFLDFFSFFLLAICQPSFFPVIFFLSIFQFKFLPFFFVLGACP